MKKILIVQLFVLLVAGLAPNLLLAHENHKSSTHNVKIGLNVPYALFGAFIAHGEFRLTERMSLLARLGYIDARASINSNVNPIEGPSAAGKIGVGGRWYWNECAFGGLFVEGNVDTAVTGTLTLKEENIAPYGRVGPFTWRLYNSFYAGYSWLTDIGFFADVSLGLEVGVVVVGEPDFSQYYPTRIKPLVRLEAGWAF